MHPLTSLTTILPDLRINMCQLQPRDVPNCCVDSHRHRINRSMLLAKVMALQPWAEGAAVKVQLDAALDKFLGPKPAEAQPLERKKKKVV